MRPYAKVDHDERNLYSLKSYLFPTNRIPFWETTPPAALARSLASPGVPIPGAARPTPGIQVQGVRQWKDRSGTRNTESTKAIFGTGNCKRSKTSSETCSFIQTVQGCHAEKHIAKSKNFSENAGEQNNEPPLNLWLPRRVEVSSIQGFEECNISNDVEIVYRLLGCTNPLGNPCRRTW